MPGMTIGGDASFGNNLKGQVEPLAHALHTVMIDECGFYLADAQPTRGCSELLRCFAFDEVQAKA